MISEVEVKKWCKRFGFKYQYVNPYSVLIYSKYDNWRIELDGKSKSRPYQLYHQNTRHNTKQEHRQHRFKDIPFLIKSIKWHDDYYNRKLFGRPSRLERLFEQINT